MSQPSTLSEPSSDVMGDQQICPRCRTQISWEGNSWCPACGFYPSVNPTGLDDESWKERPAWEPDEVVEENIFKALPVWFWVMMGGLVVVFAFGVMVRGLFPEDDGPRGLIALAVVAVGLVALAVSHLIASRDAMRKDPRINLVDAMLSWFAVWQPTIGQLPETKRRLWGASWGLAASLTGVLIIGGIDYSAPFRTDGPVKKRSYASNVVRSVADAAKAGANEATSMQDSLNQLADSPGEDTGGSASMTQALGELTDSPVADSAATESDPKSLESTYGIVYGMVTDEEQKPLSFLFAGRSRETVQHVAEIRADSLPRQEYRKLTVRLFRRVRSESAVPTTFSAVWVDPVLVCRLYYERINEDGTLHGVRFDTIVRDNSGLTARGTTIGSH